MAFLRAVFDGCCVEGNSVTNGGLAGVSWLMDYKSPVFDRFSFLVVSYSLSYNC